MFPLTEQTPANPLPAGRHRLPGMYEGEKLFWEVTTAGGREHFVIIASPTRSSTFETMSATLPQPTFNRQVRYARLSKENLGVLRSVGGLSTAKPSAAPRLSLTPGFSIPLTGTEETTSGLWIRQATFEYPD